MTLTVPEHVLCLPDQAHTPLLPSPCSIAPRPTKQGWHDVGQRPGSLEGKRVQWPTFTDLEGRVRDDVKRIHERPLVSRDLPVRGFIYDVTTGRLQEVH